MLLVKDVGELGLLARLHQFCPPQIVGDDAAVIAISPQKKLAVTTDVLVDGVHFSDRTTPPFAIGWRAITANLSDLAAMGASPLGVTVGLSLPKNLPVSWVEQLYQGMSECLKPYHTPILGGDLTSSSVITVAITALGEVAPNRVICRHGAKPGDAILITGFHGLSRAGLELLLHPELGKNLPREARQKLILAHQQPKPRLDVVPYLEQDDWPQTLAGMDSSDGLADAILQICHLSKVGARIEQDRIPLADELLKLVSPRQAMSWVLYGGEDFELVLCLSPEKAEALRQKLGVGAAIIGGITEDKRITLRGGKQFSAEIALTQSKSFQHF